MSQTPPLCNCKVEFAYTHREEQNKLNDPSKLRLSGKTFPILYVGQCSLHAAAPVLVTALRGLLDMVTDNRVHGVELDAAVEALAHAEGRS